jgi:hypothetical protein
MIFFVAQEVFVTESVLDADVNLPIAAEDPLRFPQGV